VSGRDAIEASLRRLTGIRGTVTYQPRFSLQNGDPAMGRIDFHLSGGTDPTATPVDLRGGTAEVACRQPDGTWKYVFGHPFGASPA
jgi:hypothetical protein